MRYLHSYQFVFVSPKWLSNLGYSCLCLLVPVVGQIVLIGYHFELIEAMLRDGEENYPDFDTNRLLPYLTRGVWPFVIQMFAIIPLSIVLIACYLGVVATVITSNGDPGIGVLLMFGGLFLAAIFLGVVVLPLVIMPLELRAGLTKNFWAAFSREFYVDFVRKCWKELLLAQLFIFVAGGLVMFAGSLLCLVGSYPAKCLTEYSRAHLLYQIYCRYLDKGGVPPAVKSEMAYR